MRAGRHSGQAAVEGIGVTVLVALLVGATALWLVGHARPLRDGGQRLESDGPRPVREFPGGKRRDVGRNPRGVEGAVRIGHFDKGQEIGAVLEQGFLRIAGRAPGRRTARRATSDADSYFIYIYLYID